MSAGRAWREIVRACFRQIRANEAGAQAGRDPEYLHQLRVGWRRLRSALSMRRDRPWKESLAELRPELRWVSRALGAARNWDVYTEDLLEPIGSGGPGGSAPKRELAAFRSRCASLRKQHHRAARAVLASERYRRLMLEIERRLDAAGKAAEAAPDLKARGFAKTVLTRRQRQLARCGPAGKLSAMPARKRHRLRIAAKKLRYAAELLEPLFSRKEAKRYARRLEKLQDALGELNDIANGLRMTAEVARGARDPRHDAAGRHVEAALRESERAKLPKIDRAWKRFAQLRPFWREAD